MSDLTITTPEPINRKTGKPRKVTGKASDLLDLMVQEGLTYQDAAQRIGMHIRHARKAIDSQHVLNELRRRKQVFREAICAANPRRLAAIRDQERNLSAAVRAVQVLEGIADSDAAAGNAPRMPGVLIVVGDSARPYVAHMPQQRQIEANPLKSHEAGQQQPLPRDE